LVARLLKPNVIYVKSSTVHLHTQNKVLQSVTMYYEIYICFQIRKYKQNM